MIAETRTHPPSEPIPQREAAPPSRPRRCLILANPKAGRLKRRERAENFALRAAIALGLEDYPYGMDDYSEILASLAALAAEAGLQADVEALPEANRIPDLLRNAEIEGYDTVVAAGGDGTVHAVAQGLVHSSLRLGVLPAGTANNFARALGMPFRLEDALRALAQGEERQVDVGHVGNEFFIEGAGVGFFADVLFAFGSEEPRRYEVGRVLRAVGPLYVNPPTRRLRLLLDGVEHSEDALMVTVANDAYIGENMPIAPGAGLSDGLFDVVIVGALNRRELLQFAQALAHGRHLDLPKVHRTRAARVEISRVHRSHQPIPVHADDHIAAYTPARLEVVPKALRVLAPHLQEESPVQSPSETEHAPRQSTID
jgi:YegS/Rv2252/BmrU family lipid kinase